MGKRIIYLVIKDDYDTGYELSEGGIDAPKAFLNEANAIDWWLEHDNIQIFEYDIEDFDEEVNNG